MSTNFLYNEDITLKEHIKGMQGLIDSGLAWKLEGSTGRAAMALLESGDCILGTEGYRDYYGNYVPSRREVKQGSKGSRRYQLRMLKERAASGS